MTEQNSTPGQDGISASNLVGSTLGGRYQIRSLIGRGGMAAVYKAHDPNLQRTVAIKVIHSHLSNNPDFLRRFEEEATLIARLRHPNIVQIFDFSHETSHKGSLTETQLYYMVMEYLAGETLQVHLKRLKEANRLMPVEEALRYGMDIASAASYAHQRGLVHRDIKPANVMLDFHGKAVLMDFGIARMMGAARHTATGAVLGTAMYMSPEQIQGLQADARADIYSIGVTIFEMLGGRPPFEADSAMTLMMMHLNDPVPDIRKLQPDVPLSIVGVLDKALTKKREQRYQTAEELVQALKSIQENLPKQVTPSKDAVLKATIIEGLVTQEKAPATDDRTILESPKMTGSPPGSTSPSGTSGAVTIQQRSDGQTILERPSQKPPEQSRQVAGTPTVKISPVTHPQQPGKETRRKISKGWLVLISILVLLAACFGSFFTVQNLAANRGLSIPILTDPIGYLAALFPASTEAPPVVIVITSTPGPTETAAPSPEPSATQMAQEALPAVAPTPTTTSEPPTPPVVIGGADKIAYINESDVWIANLDGSDLTRLTSDGAEKKYLRWLPGGQSLSYINGKCIKTISIQGDDQVLTCFPNVDFLDSFEVSPDGTQVVISLDNLVYLVPFDLEALKEADRHSDLEKLATCSALAPYQRNAVRSIRWSKDGKKWAAVVIGVLKDGRRGDLVHVFPVDRCIPNPLVEIQFPPPHFSYDDYQKTARLESFSWDGDALFSFNSSVRNNGFGNLQVFNMETFRFNEDINPIDQVCCYRDVQWSPDGTYLVFAFQNYLQGANSTTQLYYIPYGTIGTGGKYEPLPLPVITDPREKPQPVLRPALEP